MAQLNLFALDLDITRFDRAQFQYVVNQAVHSSGIAADDGQKPLAICLRNAACFKCFDESKDGGQWRAQLVRNIRQKLLSHELKSLQLSNVKEDTDCTLHHL